MEGWCAGRGSRGEWCERPCGVLFPLDVAKIVPAFWWIMVGREGDRKQELATRLEGTARTVCNGDVSSGKQI